MEESKKKYLKARRRAYEIVETGASADPIGRSYDIISTIVLLANLMVTILYTFDEMELRYGGVLLGIEAVSVAFFCGGLCAAEKQPVERHADPRP